MQMITCLSIRLCVLFCNFELELVILQAIHSTKGIVINFLTKVNYSFTICIISRIYRN